MGSSASGHPGLRRSVVESAIVLLLVGFAPAILAAELFRYRNSDGVIVLANTIPAEYARNGYTVIDHRGRVLRVVPRQLSGAELEARAEAEAAEQAAHAERLAQRRADEELLRLYSTPEDVDRAMERKLASIEGAIDTVKANIQRLRTQKRNLQAQAAEIERSGQGLSQNILSGIRSIQDQIAEKEREIEARQMEVLATRAEYEKDRDRLSYLLGLSMTGI